MVFTGYYEHAVDAKNRLAIPAKFRSRLDPDVDGSSFVVVPGQPSDRLWLYPERHFERLAGRADSTLIPDEDQLKFEQLFFPLAEHLELDGQGRILVPERMLRRAGLGREVVICGVRDHLEIRNREDFMTELESSWDRYQEHQAKARAAYRDSRRQTGPEAG
jgi:MraZ protein